MKILLTTLTNIMAFVLLTGPTVALAQYDYQLIDHPLTPNTDAFGINDRGDVTGAGLPDGAAGIPFIYASKKDTFTDVAPAAGYAETFLTGISDSGIMVGNVRSLDFLTLSGFIRNKDGSFSVFDHPDALSQTRARAVNNKGLVTGFRNRPTPFPPPFDTTFIAFVYDPKSNTFTDIIPESDHEQSFAQGINSKGEVVGDAWFSGVDDPCNPGNPDEYRRYGWLRAKDGTMTYFQVNGVRTAARGINDSGTIVGWAPDPFDGVTKGFVVELGGSQCQDITISTEDLLEFPGFIALFAQDINNAGVITGGVWDLDYDFGFIATPE